MDGNGDLGARHDFQTTTTTTTTGDFPPFPIPFFVSFFFFAKTWPKPKTPRSLRGLLVGELLVVWIPGGRYENDSNLVT